MSEIFEITDDGWAGHIEVDPARTLTWDATELPDLTWHIPLYHAESLADALELLDQIGALTDVSGNNTAFGWVDDVVALRAALEHLVQAGRADRHTDGQIVAKVSDETLTEQGRRLASRREDLIADGADPAELPVPLAPRRGQICPECEQGKHGNCDGTAWNDRADDVDDCTCPDPTHKESNPS